MKKICIALICLTLLFGCASKSINEESNTPIDNKDEQKIKVVTSIGEINQLTRSINFFVDEETGCQYIIVRDAGTGITPRLNEQGQPICKKEN